MNNVKEKGRIWNGLVVLAIIAIPFGLFFYFGYWIWDSQIEGNSYKAFFEKEGKIYEFSNVNARSLAFDQGTGNDQLYLNNFNELTELIGIIYGDYEVEKTDNPFFAGKIKVSNWGQYLKTEKKYSSPTQSDIVFTFSDQNGKQIFTYQPETDNEFAVKLRPTFPVFSKGKYNIGKKREYLNVSKILQAKLNKTLKIRTDEANKLLILSFGN